MIHCLATSPAAASVILVRDLPSDPQSCHRSSRCHCLNKLRVSGAVPRIVGGANVCGSTGASAWLKVLRAWTCDVVHTHVLRAHETHTPTHIHAHRHTHTPTHRHTHTNRRTDVHTHTQHTHKDNDTHTHVHKQHTRTQAHTSDAHTHTHRHTQAHAHTRTRTHTHAHTHTRSGTYNQITLIQTDIHIATQCNRSPHACHLSTAKQVSYEQKQVDISYR